jgi:hypothetical protein
MQWEIANIGIAFGNPKDTKGNIVRDQPGLSLGTELRTKMLDDKFSPGLQFTYTGWNRYSSEGGYTQHQKSFIFMAVSDYNFTEILSKIMPFAGVGLGVSMLDSQAKNDESVDNKKTYFAFSPRVGIEFYNKIRLTGEYKYQGKENSFFNVKLGFVIGL